MLGRTFFNGQTRQFLPFLKKIHFTKNLKLEFNNLAKHSNNYTINNLFKTIGQLITQPNKHSTLCQIPNAHAQHKTLPVTQTLHSK